MSEGTRLTAEVFSLKSLEGKKLPTIILCHGWGGLALHLRPEAIALARAGYLAVAFDYRGWGASDGRLIAVGPVPAGRQPARFTAEVREIREVVDPLDQTTDLLNAIHWVVGEPQCDAARIGLWGSSYSGGHVVYAAARDPRVKALVSAGPRARFALGGRDPGGTRAHVPRSDPPRPGRGRLSAAGSEGHHGPSGSSDSGADDELRARGRR